MTAATVGHPPAAHPSSQGRRSHSSRPCSRCASADISEIVAHEIDDLHRIVAVSDCWHRQDNGLVLEVNPRTRIQRVVIGRASAQMGSILKMTDVIKAVGLPVDGLRSQPPRVGHICPWKRIEIGLHAQRICILLPPVRARSMPPPSLAAMSRTAATAPPIPRAIKAAAKVRGKTQENGVLIDHRMLVVGGKGMATLERLIAEIEIKECLPVVNGIV